MKKRITRITLITLALALALCGVLGVSVSADETAATATIGKANVAYNEMTQLAFTVDVSGTLPEGVRVEYEGGEKIAVGEYDITAKFFIGDTELVEEFLLGFVRNAACSLHVQQLAGRNTHHIIEGAFKALARALRVAVSVDAAFANEVPSTKGVL